MVAKDIFSRSSADAWSGRHRTGRVTAVWLLLVNVNAPGVVAMVLKDEASTPRLRHGGSVEAAEILLAMACHGPSWWPSKCGWLLAKEVLEWSLSFYCTCAYEDILTVPRFIYIYTYIDSVRWYTV